VSSRVAQSFRSEPGGARSAFGTASRRWVRRSHAPCACGVARANSEVARTRGEEDGLRSEHSATEQAEGGRRQACRQDRNGTGSVERATIEHHLSPPFSGAPLPAGPDRLCLHSPAKAVKPDGIASSPRTQSSAAWRRSRPARFKGERPPPRPRSCERPGSESSLPLRRSDKTLGTWRADPARDRAQDARSLAGTPGPEAWRSRRHYWVPWGRRGHVHSVLLRPTGRRSASRADSASERRPATRRERRAT